MQGSLDCAQGILPGEFVSLDSNEERGVDSLGCVDSLPGALPSLILRASRPLEQRNDFDDSLSSISLAKRSHSSWSLPSTAPPKRKRQRTEPTLPTPSPLTISDERWHLCKWDECNLSFESLKDLGVHLRAHIKTQKDTNRKCKKSGYVCKWAGCARTNPFKGCYNLEHHLRYQHTGERPYQCDACSSSFAQRSDLTEHLQNIHQFLPQKPSGGLGQPTPRNLSAPFLRAPPEQSLAQIGPFPSAPPPIGSPGSPTGEASSSYRPRPILPAPNGEFYSTMLWGAMRTSFGTLSDSRGYPLRNSFEKEPAAHSHVLIHDDCPCPEGFPLSLRVSEGESYFLPPDNFISSLTSSTTRLLGASYDPDADNNMPYSSAQIPMPEIAGSPDWSILTSPMDEPAEPL